MTIVGNSDFWLQSVSWIYICTFIFNSNDRICKVPFYIIKIEFAKASVYQNVLNCKHRSHLSMETNLTTHNTSKHQLFAAVTKQTCLTKNAKWQKISLWAENKLITFFYRFIMTEKIFTHPSWKGLIKHHK